MNRRFFAADLLLHLFGLLALLSLPLSPLARELRRPFAEIAVSCSDLSADEVEGLVSRPIGNRLTALPMTEDIYSVSTMEESRIRILLRRRFDETVLLSRLLRELDELQSTLPKTASRPEVRIIHPSLPPIIIGLRIERGSFSLERLEAMADELSRRRELSRVRTAGIPERQLQVRIDPYLLSASSLRLEDVVRHLHTALLRYSAGPVEEGSVAVPVEISGGIEEAKDLGDFPLPPPLRGLRVKDIAEVTEGFPAERAELLAPAAVDRTALLSLQPKSGSTLSMAELLFRFRRPKEWLRELPVYGDAVKSHVLLDPYRLLRLRLLLRAVLLLPPLLLFLLLSRPTPPTRALATASRSLALFFILLRLFRFAPFSVPPILFGASLMAVEFLVFALCNRPLPAAPRLRTAAIVWLLPLVLLGISEREDTMMCIMNSLQEYHHYCLLEDSAETFFERIHGETKENNGAGREDRGFGKGARAFGQDVWAFRRDIGGGFLGVSAGKAWPVEEDIIDIFLPRKCSASILSSSGRAALLPSPGSVEELLPQSRSSKTTESPYRGDRWEMSFRIELESEADILRGDSARMHRIIARSIEAAGPGIDLGEIPLPSPVRVRLFYGNGVRKNGGTADGIRRLPILYENRLFSLEELSSVSSFPQAARLVAKNGDPLCLRFQTAGTGAVKRQAARSRFLMRRPGNP